MRKARIYSDFGFYHIVIRGVNKQNIFYDNADRNLFINLIKKYSKKLNIKIHAFCLMDNHVHLEIEDKLKNVSLFMQSVCSIYARLFNRKYDRIGHLFQERFASEVIKDNSYFLSVYRYIIQNPIKAGICNSIMFSWSSYVLLKQKKSFIEKKLLYDLLYNEGNITKFLTVENTDKFLEIELRPSERKLETINLIKEILKAETPIIPLDLPRSELNRKVRKLKHAGLSVRTISRVTGVSLRIAQLA